MEATERSLWSKILRHVPPAEVDEVSREVGVGDIDDTESLWSELCLLRDIAQENITSPALMNATSISQPSTTAMSSSAAGPKSGPSKVPSLPFHSATVSASASKTASASASWTSSHQDLVDSIAPYLNVDRIADVTRDIRTALQEERVRILDEIAALTRAMDQQTDAMLTDRSSPRERELREAQTKQQQQQQQQQKEHMQSKQLQQSSKASAVCRDCGAVVAVTPLLAHSIPVPIGGTKKPKDISKVEPVCKRERIETYAHSGNGLTNTTSASSFHEDGDGRAVHCQSCREKRERRDRKLSDKLSKSAVSSASTSASTAASSVTSSTVVFGLGSVSMSKDKEKEKEKDKKDKDIARESKVSSCSSLATSGDGKNEINDKLMKQVRSGPSRNNALEQNKDKDSSKLLANSRVRNKLQAARDEKHFLEDT